jgi:hypothetical protein
VVEFLFGSFFLYVVIEAAMDAKYSSAILLLPFPIGFFYTSLSSLARMLPSRKVEVAKDMATISTSDS